MDFALSIEGFNSFIAKIAKTALDSSLLDDYFQEKNFEKFIIPLFYEKYYKLLFLVNFSFFINIFICSKNLVNH